MNQPLLFPENLETFCQAIHRKGAALDHCWGFVDGTVRLQTKCYAEISLQWAQEGLFNKISVSCCCQWFNC